MLAGKAPRRECPAHSAAMATAGDGGDPVAHLTAAVQAGNHIAFDILHLEISVMARLAQLWLHSA